ncbi:MAG: hypothetical protein ABSA23_13125 [Anaerolineales bacterium]
MPYPHYSYHPLVVPGLVASVIFGGLRSFSADGRACMERINPSLRI